MSSSEHFDCLIVGGLTVSSKGITRQDVFIREGKIVHLGLANGSTVAGERIDASGKFVLPGLIDAHCHPVYADRMDTLSRAAVLGGVTTPIPFIGALKAWGETGTPAESLKKFLDEGREHSWCDFGVHFTFVQDNLPEVETLISQAIREGILSFKTFMAYSARGMKLEDREILRLMEVIREHGGLFMVHAENGAIIDYLVKKFQSEGKTTPEYLLRSQPHLVESEAVYRALTMASLIRTPLYLPHLSAAESLDVVRWFRSRGIVKVYTETCPHYLTLTDEEMKKHGTLAKVAPPLRYQKDVDAYWQALNEGLIDVVATDYAGRVKSKKEPIWKDVFIAPHGLPDLEAMLPVLYEEGVNQGRIPLPLLVKVTSEMPARIFGIYPPKGALECGFDADLVLFDPSAPHAITAASRVTKVDYSIYEGRKGLGAPVLTMRRGKVLAQMNELAAAPGEARFIPGEPNLALYNQR